MQTFRSRCVLFLACAACSWRGGAAGDSSEGDAVIDQECYSEEQWRSQDLLDFSHGFNRCGPNLVCVKGHPNCEEYCTQGEECQRFPLNECSDTTFTCQHKALFQHTVAPDLGAAFLFFGISGLALSAGIGGGGLYVPLLSIILGFSVRQASALSQACLAGGASSALMYNLRQRHPSGEKPMIDYDLVLVMGPMLLAGAIMGSILNATAPSWLIAVLLLVVLTHSGIKASDKAVKTWKKESKGDTNLPRDARLSKNPIDRCLRLLSGKQAPSSEAPAASAASPTAKATTTAPPVSAPAQQAVVEPKQDAASPQAGSSELDMSEIDLHSKTTKNESATTATEEKTKKQPQYPMRPLATFAAIWGVVLMSIFARGGPHTSGLVSYCSSGYWLLALLTIAALTGISFLSARRTVEAHAQGEDVPAAGDNSPTSTDPLGAGKAGFQWDQQGATRIMMWSLLAGTLAAMCGIGGGMVMGPRLLDLGFAPQVQSATTATTLFVMSTSTCLAFLVAGAVPVDYAVWLALSTAMGAVVGKAIVGYIVKKLRRPSVIMFILAGIIAMSVMVMTLTAVFDVANDLKEGNDMGFKSPCHAA